MSSPDFDAPPRDEIHPTAEEVRRSPVSRAPHPDEFDGPDDIEIDEEQITRSRIPPASWPKLDSEAPDYAHLEPGGREPLPGAKRFRLGAADIELLLQANGFDPKGPDGRIVFGFRGALLVDDGDGRNDGVVAGVDTITLEDTRPDHRNFRCTIGILNRETGKISAFRASTVPNVKYLTNYFMWNNGLGGNSSTGANMLPTGCYVYRMGAHGGGRIYPALRLTDPDRLAEDGQACVLRTKNDLTFKVDDLLDHCTPYDNIHCAYAFDTFSSAGCQTIQGPNGEGPWGQFQSVLRTMKVNTRIDYVLLTGRDAALAAWLRESGKAEDPEMVAKWIGRLRPGSIGESVRRLQQHLGMKPSGYFGAATKKKLGDAQRSKGVLADGIWSPRAEDKLGWAVLGPAPEPVAKPSPTVPATASLPTGVLEGGKPAKPEEPVGLEEPAIAAPAASTLASVPSVPAAASAEGAEPPTGPHTLGAEIEEAEAAPEAGAKPDVVVTNPSASVPAVSPAASAPASSEANAVEASSSAETVLEPVQPMAPPSDVGAGSALAELEKLIPEPDASPEAPGIVDVAVARSPVTTSRIGAGDRLAIDATRLQAFAPDTLAQYEEALLGGNDTLTRYGINQSPLRLCHFLAHIAAESVRFTVLDENLLFRSSQRLRAVWPSRFPTASSAEPYVNNPQKLAEKVYGDRYDNRPGDGWRYRGRGLVLLTGRAAYRDIGRKLGIDLENQPELACEPRHLLAIACESWLGNALPGERDTNRLADANKIEALAYRAVGSHWGIEDRREAFEDAWRLWGIGEPPRRPVDSDTLERGDRAGRVEELNARLEALSLYEAANKGRPTLVYNRATYGAVRRLQEEAGLAQTGVATPDIWPVLDNALEEMAAGKRRAASPRPGSAPGREPSLGPLKEIRAWSIALSLLAVGFVATYIYALTHSTGNTPLWMPLVFAGMVFVTGLAMLLAAQSSRGVDGEGRSSPRKREGGPVNVTHGFTPGEEEPARLRVNI